MIDIMNSIVFDLMEEPEQYQPIFATNMVDDEEYPVVDEWCFGYIRGISLCLEEWDVNSEPMHHLLAPIIIFGSEEMNELRANLDNEEIYTLQQQITPCAKEIHAYWLEQREKQIAAEEIDSTNNKIIPEYSNDYLRNLSEADLIELMLSDEDRVPRNVIDECATRGDKMLKALAPMANPVDELHLENSGRWWIRLHALMILGLIPGENAGMLLLQFIDYMNQNEGDLQDWLSGYWPALTRNKPQSIIEKLREISEEPQHDLFLRLDLSEAVIAAAYQQGEAELEKALDRVAEIVADENEDWEFRMLSANTLLNFPRERNRQLLDQMAALQSGIETIFNKKDVNKSYSAKKDMPPWEPGRDPWDFYQIKAIKERQQRWEKERAWGAENELDYEDELFDEPDRVYNWGSHQPYERETPRVGRNDPCPCGSGKKFKKCCLH